MYTCILKNDNIRGMYPCLKTWCRTSDTLAIEMNVADEDIDVANM